jgi:hypothetical protein
MDADMLATGRIRSRIEIEPECPRNRNSIGVTWISHGIGERKGLCAQRIRAGRRRPGDGGKGECQDGGGCEDNPFHGAFLHALYVPTNAHGPEKSGFIAA